MTFQTRPGAVPGQRLPAHATDSRGRGRPTTGVKIQVRIPADVLAELDRYASETGTTRAGAIRRAVSLFVSP